jgi:bifunctional enzyme CysN/CysC
MAISTHAAQRLPEPQRLPRLRIMTCGSVDDGKSTLIGRLLYESGAVFEDHLLEAERASGGALDFSYLVDGLKAEREQGITIDVAYRYFTTAKRAFLIADAPGHEQYTRNQAAAASQTQLANVLVSAADGVREQTRRHMAIAALFGVRHVVLAINKMDLVGWRREPFDEIAAELKAFAASLGLKVVATIPLSARSGDNVVTHSAALDWYTGPTLLDVLETFEPPEAGSSTTILPIALTGRLPHGGRVSFGEIAAGEIAVGQAMQTETRLDVTISRLWSAGEAVERARAGEAVAVELAPERDLGRGAVLVSGETEIAQATQLRVRFVWLAKEALKSGGNYSLQLAKGETNATVSRIEGRLDLQDLTIASTNEEIGTNDIAVGRLSLTKPLPALPFAASHALGSFILVDRITSETVAAGIVLSIEKRSGDTPWQTMQITPENRSKRMGQRPAVIWLTGLSGAGKSTIADLLDRRLHALGRHATVLDGDNLRSGLNADLGFSDADRVENMRRVAHVAALMADAGLIVIVSLISPFREQRQEARDVVGADRFLEVFVDAPLEVCQQRDPKGFYARARQGGMPRFTGLGATYEPPLEPDLHLHTDKQTPEQAAEMLVSALRKRGLEA